MRLKGRGGGGASAPFASFMPSSTTTPMRNLPIATLMVVAVVFVVAVRCDGIDEDSANDNSTAPMERSEQEALYNVIQGFVGKWWDGRQLYPDPCGWTAIQGVGCDLIDGLWRVTSLSIGPVLDNSLRCSSSPEFRDDDLSRLPHLRSLSFFQCFTSTNITFPSTTNWWSSSNSLTTLELRSNPSLTGPLPSSLSRLSNLRSLVLSDTSLSGPIPPALSRLTRLRRLVLSRNRLSGEIPPHLLHHMKDLLILDLGGNALVGPLPPSLGDLPSLLKLDLSGNSIEGGLPAALKSPLTLLDLRGNNVTGGVPNSLEKVTSLQVLLLSGNPLGGNLSGFRWETMENLNTLDLSRTGIGGRIPESMAEMKELSFLALDSNRLVGEVPMGIAGLRKLGALYLNGNNLTGALGFDGEFYGRLGRRFAAWGNPNLCYSDVGGEDGAVVPHGVNRCSRGGGGGDDGYGGDSSGSNSMGGVDRSWEFSRWLIVLATAAVVYCCCCGWC